MSGEPLTARVPESLAGVRVDRAVSMLTGTSRAVAAALVAEGRVLLDGAPVRTGSRPLVAGATLEVALPPPAVLAGDPGVDVDVVHEDGALVVVDKAAGVVVHPGAGHAAGTLVSGLLARYPELAGVGDPGRPGIVHRLDRGTSGLLAVARTEAAYRSLRRQLEARTVGRRYLALVGGHLAHDRGVVDAPLGRSARTPTKMAVAASGRPARTSYRVLRRLEVLSTDAGARSLDATLLECALETGRTHQIRVHLAAIGHPVVGDDRYGRPPRGVVAPGRLFLHAADLALDHPEDGRRVSWRSPLPADLAAVVGDEPLRGGVVGAGDGAVG